MTTQSNQCLVCLKTLNDPRWIPCKHMYCFKCIPQLHRRDLDSNDQIVLECRQCSALHKFHDWSSAKYYVTLHCVPYVMALQLESSVSSSSATITNMCPTCFNTPRHDGLYFEYCDHCEKNVCHQCLIDHRNELKKRLLQTANQCRFLMGKNYQHIEQTLNKLQALKMIIDSRASKWTDQIEMYCESLQLQIDEQQLNNRSMVSSGYESLSERLSGADCHMNHVSDLNQNDQRQCPKLTNPTTVAIGDLLGEMIPSILPAPRFLWSIACSSQPSHLVFESITLKLFVCSHYGDVSVYDYHTSSLMFVHTFSLNEFIRSITACAQFLVIVTNSPNESILHIYSHNGCALVKLPFPNECISQIRFDADQLWCLELVSSTLFYFTFPSNLTQSDILPKRIEFISFKTRVFDPFRFALNQTLVAIVDRTSAGIVLLFDKLTSTQVKHITSPLNNCPLSDIELNNQMLIYRSPRMIYLQLLSTSHGNGNIDRIDIEKSLSIVKGKFDSEILIGTPASDRHTFMIQCYAQTV